jgi:hypothetical protein
MKYAIIFNARHIAILEMFDTLDEAIKYRKDEYGDDKDYLIIQVW